MLYSWFAFCLLFVVPTAKGPVLLYDERGKKIAEVGLDYSVEIVRQPQQQGQAGAQAEDLGRKDTLSTSSMLNGSGTFDTLDSVIQI